MEETVNIFEATLEHFLAPVMQFMEDPTVSEIMVNNPHEIYVEQAGRLVRTDAAFEDDEAFAAAINNVLQYTGKRMDFEHPLIDARLPDGSRVHVILGKLSRAGTCMTIRKFSKQMFDAEHLVKLGSWTAEAKEYMEFAVLAEKNMLVAGGTSSGKTSLLNVLSNFIPNHQRIVVIEDSSELELQQEHLIQLESRPPDRWGRGEVTIRDLFRSSLRLRPDRIVIGEVRGGEALDMIQAMTSGHAGSMSTLHANMATDALNRLETLAMMSKVDLPLHALRAQIASAIDVIVLVSRFSDGGRGLTQITEVLPLDRDGRYQAQDVFEYRLHKGADAVGKPKPGMLAWTGARSAFADEPKVQLLWEEMDLTREIFRRDGQGQQS